MVNAWVVRPNPGGDRLQEFRTDEMVAIGWPSLGDLTQAEKSDIRQGLKDSYDWNNYKVGQNTGQINRFVNEMEVGDHVLVPSGGNIYFGKIDSEYYFDSNVAEEGYPHQRDVKWEFNGDAIDRSSLPGQLHDSLKGRLTVFSTNADLIEEVDHQDSVTEGADRYTQLQNQYLKKLRAGELHGIQSSSFEDAVNTVLDNYFPGISRQATTSDENGDTDLKADLPGGITVRVQVKHYYSDQGKLSKEAIHQLAASMEPGDNGIVVTATDVSEAAQKAANQSEMKVEIIDGAEFTDLLFENIEEFSSKELNTLGLRREPELLR